MTPEETKCCFIPCDKQAEWGAIKSSDQYEWFYGCSTHLGEILSEDEHIVRPIEQCPPFCDELSAKLPMRLRLVWSWRKPSPPCRGLRRRGKNENERI